MNIMLLQGMLFQLIKLHTLFLPLMKQVIVKIMKILMIIRGKEIIYCSLSLDESSDSEDNENTHDNQR